MPSAQAGFWVGGFHSSGITTADGEQTQEYATGMLAFNTTTQDSLQVGAPFTPVLDGALIHLPYGDQGILIFLGGETPSALSGTHLDETATPVSQQHLLIEKLRSLTSSDSHTEQLVYRSYLRHRNQHLVPADSHRLPNPASNAILRSRSLRCRYLITSDLGHGWCRLHAAERAYGCVCPPSSSYLPPTTRL